MPNATTTTPGITPQTPPSVVKKIGNITYRVWAHFSEASTETVEGKIKRMLQNEVRQMVENE